VNLVVPHQANLRILEAVAKRIDVPRERIYANLERYGNTSAARTRASITVRFFVHSTDIAPACLNRRRRANPVIRRGV
jgi:3-oxoacyl-[acyl-carrier-protein] synthase III